MCARVCAYMSDPCLSPGCAADGGEWTIDQLCIDNQLFFPSHCLPRITTVNLRGFLAWVGQLAVLHALVRVCEREREREREREIDGGLPCDGVFGGVCA